MHMDTAPVFFPVRHSCMSVASILARAGHDVLKVESPGRADGARRGPRAFLGLMNADKSSAALDLREDRDVLHPHARRGPSSSRRRRSAMEQLGYRAEDWLDAPRSMLGVDLEVLRLGGSPSATTPRTRRRRRAAEAFRARARRPSAGTRSPTRSPGCTSPPLLARLAAGRGGLLAFSLRDVAAYCARQPVFRRGSSWTETAGLLRGGGARVTIEPPRARRVSKRAPALRRAGPELSRVWRTPTCRLRRDAEVDGRRFDVPLPNGRVVAFEPPGGAARSRSTPCEWRRRVGDGCVTTTCISTRSAPPSRASAAARA